MDVLPVIGKISFVCLTILTVVLSALYTPIILAESIHSGILIVIGYAICVFLTVPKSDAIIGSDILNWEDVRSSWAFTSLAAVLLAIGIGTIQVTTYSPVIALLIFSSFILETVLTSAATIIFAARFKAYVGDPRERHRIRIRKINSVPQYIAIYLLSYLPIIASVELLVPEFARWIIILALCLLFLFNALDPKKDFFLRVLFGCLFATYVALSITFLFDPPQILHSPLEVDVMQILTWIELGINGVIALGSVVKHVREK